MLLFACAVIFFLLSTHHIFVDLRTVLKLFLRHILKTSSRHYQSNNFPSSKTSKNVFKSSSRHPQNIFKKSSKHVLKASWRTKKYLQGRDLYLYLTNLNLHLTNLYLTNLYLTNVGGFQDKTKMH